MESQENEFTAAYGEAMFYAHLIESLLALHLYECSYFHINGYPGLSRKKIRDLKHEKRIDELLKIYSHQKDGSIERLVAALHLLREIRNRMTHAFIPQVGSDMRTEEGVEQILAMLKNVSYWERGWLAALKKAHEAVLRGALTHHFNVALKREDPPFDARVARSEIQQRLGKLRALLKP